MKKIKTALHYFYFYIKHLSIELPLEFSCWRPSPMLSYNGFQFWYFQGGSDEHVKVSRYPSEPGVAAHLRKSIS